MVMSPLVSDRWPLAHTQNNRGAPTGTRVNRLVLLRTRRIVQTLATADAKGGGDDHSHGCTK